MIYHGDDGLRDITETVRQAIMDIGPYKNRFDFIAVTGMSGVLVGSPVAVRLSVPLVVIRKQGDNAHSSRTLINSAAAHGKYLFLDDFISLGSTFRRVMKVLGNDKAEYAGTYLYESRALSWCGDGIVTFSDLHDNYHWNVGFRRPASPGRLHLDEAAA